MKKITILVALLTYGVNAQVFPAPYCDIDDAGTTVEEITTISFGDVSFTNTDTSSILVDMTSEIAVLESTSTVATFSVAGNTAGNFDNEIVAFIDWNQNEILNDPGEVYEMGTITSSDGNDGVTVSFEISIPAEALLGETRVRVTKIYTDADSPAEIDPCAISFNPFGQGVFPGFGQALDFSLQVGILDIDSFDTSALNIYPLPTNGVLNVSYKTELTGLKLYNILGQEIISNTISATNTTIDMSGLNPGIYMLKVFSETGSHSVRVVKE